MDETRGALEARKSIVFTIPGKPKGKDRHRYRATGRFVQAYTPAETRAYEKRVARAYVAAGGTMIDGPVEVLVRIAFAPPKDVSKKNRASMLADEIVPRLKPDGDNTTKIVMDGLNGVAYKDDVQVIDEHSVKFYAEEAGVEVIVTPSRKRFLK